MRRRKSKSTQPVEETRSKLAPPFPSAPHRGTMHAVYVRNPDLDRFCCMTFAATYAAKAFVEFTLRDEPFTVLPPNTPLGYTIPDTIKATHSGVEIRIPSTLQQVLSYRPSQAEEEWELPTYHQAIALSMHRALSSPSDTDSDDQPAATRQPKQQRSPAPDKSGLITIGEIAASLSLHPRDARAALRKSGTPKPNVGWAFTPAEVDNIKSIIKANAK